MQYGREVMRYILYLLSLVGCIGQSNGQLEIWVWN